MKRLKLQTGSNIVEFALILPLLLVLVFGIIDFGLALFDKAVITNASREGARAGMVFKVPRMTDAEIRAVVQNYTSTHLVTFGSPNLQTTISRLDNDGLGGNTSSGDTLSVVVNYPYRYLVMDKLVPSLGSLNLRATSVMRYE
jgi:Flp pilus assembly protein TadG